MDDATEGEDDDREGDPRKWRREQPKEPHKGPQYGTKNPQVHTDAKTDAGPNGRKEVGEETTTATT